MYRASVVRLRPAFKPIQPLALILRLYASSPFPPNPKKAQEREMENMPWYKRWANYSQTNQFKRRMTKYYVLMFAVMLVAFYYYMRDRWYEDQQMKHIRKKYAQDPASLSEYEYLKFKALSGDNLKPREEKKFRLYQMMRKEFRRKHILDTSVMFEPTPEQLEEWYGKQARKRTVAVETEPEVSNAHNPSIVAAQDTTDFYDAKAAEYDDAIKWEERGAFIGRRRKWLMRQLDGDVLEVACGTGRNIPYLDPELVDSITFCDSSPKMVEETQRKFRERFPKFQKAAFAVGRAEQLQDIASGMRYDTVVEAFGLCAHKDPVQALRSMAALLKPGGRLVLLEHGRGTWQMMNNHLDFRAEKRMKTWACRWNLDIGELVDDAGLDITYEKRVHFGTTWMLVCKRPEDPLRLEEKPFINKLFGSEAPKVAKG